MRILITGGTGSFGQGFVKLLVKQPNVEMVRVYSRDEHKQRLMRLENKPDRVSFYIGDVRDKDRLKRAMDGVTHVVHAAALKQAPLGEVEAQEFIKTNINGTMNVIEAALDLDIQGVLLVSTDKAVEPINLYGATKMCAEKMILQADKTRGTKQTRFSFTRYGNVAGTSGSVIPLFQSLPDEVPTPICDSTATRFWITLEEANKFVLDCLVKMRGGEAFIPKIPSVKILDIAEAIRPGKACSIIGLRPGDKIHEVLSVDGERYSSDKNEFLSVDQIREHVYGRDNVSVG